MFLSLLTFLFAIPAIITAAATVNLSSKLSTIFQPCLFLAPEIFVPDTYGTKNRHYKTGTGKWSRFMAPIS